jgi:hypothetical protein
MRSAAPSRTCAIGLTTDFHCANLLSVLVSVIAIQRYRFSGRIGRVSAPCRHTHFNKDGTKPGWRTGPTRRHRLTRKFQNVAAATRRIPVRLSGLCLSNSANRSRLFQARQDLVFSSGLAVFHRPILHGKIQDLPWPTALGDVCTPWEPKKGPKARGHPSQLVGVPFPRRDLCARVVGYRTLRASCRSNGAQLVGQRCAVRGSGPR